ncbi:unnamed protein product [Paramecium sonneborni]|uniref:Ubiquitin-like protease family profile domain-containing protein n=1 Tax=Paramecium sonneborni TaxID=65129 RepID=A0A8S1MG61_9CILI|nr:unnamed protein product [Paramecium sonneborni]
MGCLLGICPKKQPKKIYHVENNKHEKYQQQAHYQTHTHQEINYPNFQKNPEHQKQNSIIRQQCQLATQECDHSKRKTFLANSYQINDDQWDQNCEKYDFDLINLKDQSLLLFQNIQFYCDQKKLKIKSSQGYDYEVEGFIYKTEYDKNKNPKFTIQKGIFQINLEKKEFQLNGEGVEYCGKSEIIKHQGKFEKGKFLEDPKIMNCNQNQMEKKKQHTIIIIDMDTGKQVNLKQNNRKAKNQVQQIWCKYNQQISINDISILDSRKWLTSSIIDGYVLKLNLEGEEKYFQFKQSKRKEIKRILFLPSSFTTNFGDKYDLDKVKKLMKQELLEYSQMNLEITKIYKKIGLPINQRNFHWYFLLFDAELEQVEIFDSSSMFYDKQKSDEKLITTLEMLFKMNINNKMNHQNSGQQRDSYSCGYRVCSFMKFCFEKQFNETISYKYDESKIIKILKNTIVQVD